MTVSAELLGVLITVLAVGFALAGLTLAEIRGLRADMREHRAEILARLDRMRQDINGQLQAMEQKIVGQLDAMRQDINGRLDAMGQQFNGQL